MVSQEVVDIEACSADGWLLVEAIRRGNGFPRRVPNDCDLQFPNSGGRRVAYRP